MPSMVWTCFQKTEAGPRCILCHDVRRRRDSSTKTMWVHLRLKHQEIYKSLRDTSNVKKQVASPAKTSEASKNFMTQNNQALMPNYINPMFQVQNYALMQQLLMQTLSTFPDVNKFIIELYTQALFNTTYSTPKEPPPSKAPSSLVDEANFDAVHKEHAEYRNV